MSASPHSTLAPIWLRATFALLVTLLALGGALIGAVLLAIGALLTLGMRALGIGGRRSTVSAHGSHPSSLPGVIEGEYRIVEEPHRP